MADLTPDTAADPVTRLAEAFWVTGPLRWQRRYPSLRGVVGDWHGLALAPPVAVLASIVVAVGYGLVGAAGIGFVQVYSESLVLMASLIALGAFSGQLGLLGLVSFALGDFIVGQRTWTANGGFAGLGGGSFVETVIRARLPLIVSYLLLAVAVTVIPRLGKNIALGVGQWRRIPTDIAWLVATPMVVLVSWLGLRTWAAMAPTLMRPFFVWRGGAPTVEAIEVFQAQTSQLVAAGVAATLVRQVVNALFIYIPPLGNRLQRLETRAVERVSGTTSRVGTSGPASTGRRLMSDVFSALVASLVLVGILETRWLWLICFGAFLVVRLLRSGTVNFGLLERWKAVAARVPVVVRLGLMWLAAVLYRSLLTNEAIGSYRAMAFVVLAGVVVAFIVFPGQPISEAGVGGPGSTGSTGAPGGNGGGRPGVGRRTGVAAT